jgi:hypothetical protein
MNPFSQLSDALKLLIPREEEESREDEEGREWRVELN